MGLSRSRGSRAPTTAEEGRAVMDSVSLAEAVKMGRLQEQEAWAVVCQSLEAIRQGLASLGKELAEVDRWRSAVVTQHTLLLTPGGEIRLEHGPDEDLTGHLPQKMKPLLDMTTEDLERLAIYSLAKTVLASLESVKSQDLLLLLRSALVPSLSSVPLLSKVAHYTSKTIKSQSAQRIVSSLYYKYLGLKGHSMRKSSTVRSLPSFPTSSSALMSQHPPPLPPKPLISLETSSSINSLSTSITSSNSFATSTTSSGPVSPPCERSQSNPAELRLRFGVREHHYEDIDDFDTKSVESVCNFINNNDVFSLLELPGLKYNKSKQEKSNNNLPTTPPLPPKKSQDKHKSVSVILLSGQRVKVNLKTRDTTISEVLAKAVATSKVAPADRELFCLAVKKGGEYLFLAPTERASEASPCLHLRFLHYPTTVERLNPCLKELLYHQVSHDLAEGGLQLDFNMEGLGVSRLLGQVVDAPHYGCWQYHGTADKREDSETMTLWVGPKGVQLAGRLVAWKDVQQISYSHTFIQLLCQEGHRLKKVKVCLSQTRYVYDLMMVMKDYCMNRNKADTFKSKQRELFKLENLCDQLVKLTKDVVKTIGTPKRKRSKSLDPAACKALKKPKMQRSLTLSDTKKPPPNQPYRYKLYLEPEEDEQYVPVEKIHSVANGTTPRKTRIRTTTNPLTTIDPNQLPATKGTTPRRPRMAMGTRTPTRMGTRIQPVTIKRHQDTAMVPRRIVCICLSRNEVEEATMKIEKTEVGLEILEASGGKLVPGDRLVAVNGRSMEGAGVERAGFLLHNSGHLLNFIISRA